jgi:predicted house-cleaning noncanonical NTP pyrophosphatase (MazG superfamily)
MIKFNKLVRDNIPEIIKKNGQIPRTKVLPEEEYKYALEEKLKEEVNEYISDNSIEELADILEVLDAIVQLNKFTWQEIINKKNIKKEQRGDFSKRLFLIDRTE